MSAQLSYKHAASVTSQVYFCAAPIRLDSYDACQFGCTYCFSRKRARISARAGVHEASVGAFQRRLERVARGEIASALDEFLQKRVPIQLGGLQDPFSPREADRGVTLGLLKLLRDAHYPTLISTKGSLLLESPYIEVLSEMDVVVRLSAAGVSEALRPALERGCDSFQATLRKLSALSERRIACALRIQPVLPGFEEEALSMAAAAAGAGAKQVTFEYLKLPSEEVRAEMSAAKRALGFDIVARMKAMGLRKVGPDWSLTPEVKRPFVRAARAQCKKLSVRFGAGDTEFIPWSDGNGCCGSSDLFLDNANQFVANFVGAIKYAIGTSSKRVEFGWLEQAWSPSLSISNYMDSRARAPKEEGSKRSDWIALMDRRWSGAKSPYSPSFFDGVVATGEKDDAGRVVYDASALSAELC